jgi:prevent-host-death family protein
MSKTVGVREAKARFSHYVDVARTEGDVIITDHGRPVARLSGIHRVSRRSLDDVLNELAEAGLIDLGSPRAAEKGAVKPRAGHSVSKAVREMRR